MSVRIERTRADGSIIEIAITELGDGNFHIDAEPLALRGRRQAVMDGDWVVVRQVHGGDIVDAVDIAERGLDADDAPHADAVMVSTVGVPIAVQGADCAPLAFVTDRGPIAVAHAGWRGLAAGVVQTAVSTLASEGATVVEVLVGPVIGPECYEFGAEDLDAVANELGDGVRGQTSCGTPALDMKAAITAACATAGVQDVAFVRPCTACGDGGFSHRARKDLERHALVARIRP